MRLLKVKESFSNDEINAKIKSQSGYNDTIDWLIIRAVQIKGLTNAKEIATVLGVSVQKVYKVIQDYNKSGSEFKKNVKWGGRRKNNCYLSKDEELEVLESLKSKAAKGQLLTAKDIQKTFEKKIGHSVTQDYIWKMLKRNNWTKKTPRPEHPKTDYEKQEDFKKKYQKIWLPQS
jgi:transposase